jgi:uncharacterized protein YbaP (TraB family)
VNEVLETASVPEHSVEFMQAMSGGEAFLSGAYLFFGVDDSLLCIGYPLEGAYDPVGFDEALQGAPGRTRPDRCWAICPCLPGRLASRCLTRDHYFLRDTAAPVPERLVRAADRASACLRVDQAREFTGAHRRLWLEFISRIRLPDNVRELFARTERVLALTPGLSLLNAWDMQGRLAACMLLDEAPRGFTSYLIGARAFDAAVPHAGDLLMREAIARARNRGVPFLNLGLGVNEGIRRFKIKWGAHPGLPYEMAAWQEPRRGVSAGRLPLLAALPGESMSRRAAFDALPRQRRFAMLWELEKNGRRSWIGGTAHFFCFSFDFSFRDLFEKVDTVLFEGPLDPASLDRVAAIGNTPVSESPRVIDLLSEEEIRCLERVVCGPRGFWARTMGLEQADPPDVRGLLSRARPWMAFFTLWTRFLARHGWTQSVDLEAWQIAHEMGKSVHAMESIPEQIETLESIPMPRIAAFIRSCRRWDGYIRRNVRAYLKGDVDNMYGTSIEFPTRTELVIQRRDARFLERMRPFLGQGRCAVFVGSAHMINLRGMLSEAGFKVRRAR